MVDPFLYYYLDENEQPVAVPGWREAMLRERWQITDTVEGFWVSTVFLAIDQSFNIFDKPHTPLLFETMIWDQRNLSEDDKHRGKDVYQDRYATIAEARAGHQRAIEWCRANKDNLDIEYGPDYDFDDQEDVEEDTIDRVLGFLGAKQFSGGDVRGQD